MTKSDTEQHGGSWRYKNNNNKKNKQISPQMANGILGNWNVIQCSKSKKTKSLIDTIKDAEANLYTFGE